MPFSNGRGLQLGRLRQRHTQLVREEVERTVLDPRVFLTQRPTQFRQGDILELTDSLSRNPKLLSHFFEGLRLVTI